MKIRLNLMFLSLAIVLSGCNLHKTKNERSAKPEELTSSGSLASDIVLGDPLSDPVACYDSYDSALDALAELNAAYLQTRSAQNITAIKQAKQTIKLAGGFNLAEPNNPLQICSLAAAQYLQILSHSMGLIQQNGVAAQQQMNVMLGAVTTAIVDALLEGDTTAAAPAAAQNVQSAAAPLAQSTSVTDPVDPMDALGLLTSDQVLTLIRKGTGIFIELLAGQSSWLIAHSRQIVKLAGAAAPSTMPDEGDDDDDDNGDDDDDDDDDDNSGDIAFEISRIFEWIICDLKISLAATLSFGLAEPTPIVVDDELKKQQSQLVMGYLQAIGLSMYNTLHTHQQLTSVLLAVIPRAVTKSLSLAELLRAQSNAVNAGPAALSLTSAADNDLAKLATDLDEVFLALLDAENKVVAKFGRMIVGLADPSFIDSIFIETNSAAADQSLSLTSLSPPDMAVLSGIATFVNAQLIAAQNAVSSQMQQFTILVATVTKKSDSLLKED